MKDIPKQKPGFPIRAPWLNTLRTNQNVLKNTIGVDPVSVQQVGDSIQIRTDLSVVNLWAGKIFSESAFSDSRYWVQRQQIANDGGTDSDVVTFSDEAYPRSDAVVATNLAELGFIPSDLVKALRDDEIVTVWEVRDSGSPPQSRYLFNGVLKVGSFINPHDASYTGEHDEEARGSDVAWDRSDQAATSDGYKGSFVTGSAYYHDSNQVWYEHRVDITWDKFGANAVVSSEYRATVDTPVECPTDVDGGTY